MGDNDLARLAGLEPATLGLEGRCSIQMSYRRFVLAALSPSPLRRIGHSALVAIPGAMKSSSGRGRGIRTPDPLLPKQVRYQAALCPDKMVDNAGRYERRR